MQRNNDLIEIANCIFGIAAVTMLIVGVLWIVINYFMVFAAFISIAAAVAVFDEVVRPRLFSDKSEELDDGNTEIH